MQTREKERSTTAVLGWYTALCGVQVAQLPLRFAENRVLRRL